MIRHISGIIFAVLVVFALIAAYATYVSLRQDPEQLDNVGKQEEPKMLSYSNSTYGISFKYPSTYQLAEKEVGDAHRAHYSIVLMRKEDLPPPQNGEGPPAISIDIYQNDIDRMELVDWVVGTSYSNFKLGTGTYTSTSVSGVEAVRYNWSGLYEGETVAFAHQKNIVAASVTYLDPNNDIRRDFDTLLASILLD
ncbi:hypothetical protein HY969_04545 [Candidatus Kaiserbacteria bacterium]|nr:hypothetical protein [Candidatus Kaiserbacteria bacterium]